MTEIKQHEAQTPDATPAGVHKKWYKNTSTMLLLTTAVCPATYVVTIFAGLLQKSIEATPDISAATANAIHGTASSLGAFGAVGYIGTIVLIIGTAAAAYDEFTHYNE